MKNATTPDGYKVNEEGIWKQAVAAVNSDAVKPEQKQEANSSIVEQPKQDSNLEANASEKKEKRIKKKIPLLATKFISRGFFNFVLI